MSLVHLKSTPIADGLSFGEGPRFRDNLLYYSDVHAGKVCKFDPKTRNIETVVEMPNGAKPSGLGWLPDGSLIIVNMHERKLMKWSTNGVLSTHANLTLLTEVGINDMVVSPSGVAYVGTVGFDLDGMAKSKGWPYVYEHATDKENLGRIIAVDKNGNAKVAATDMAFPNGPWVLPGGKTYLVGETFGHRISAFDIASDGSLSNRRVWAPTGPKVFPDGVCWDEQRNALWVGNGGGKNIHLFAEGGAILARIDCTMLGIACALGGSTLYIVTAPDANAHKRTGKKEGKIEAVDVSGVVAARGRM